MKNLFYVLGTVSLLAAASGAAKPLQSSYSLDITQTGTRTADVILRLFIGPKQIDSQFLKNMCTVSGRMFRCRHANLNFNFTTKNLASYGDDQYTSVYFNENKTPFNDARRRRSLLSCSQLTNKAIMFSCREVNSWKHASSHFFLRPFYRPIRIVSAPNCNSHQNIVSAAVQYITADSHTPKTAVIKADRRQLNFNCQQFRSGLRKGQTALLILKPRGTFMPQGSQPPLPLAILSGRRQFVWSPSKGQ